MITERNRRLFHVTALGLLVNLVLCVVKILAGILGRSQAVLADGIHSVSDAATDIAVLIGIRYWSEPADRRHPYGHGRLEILISLGLAILLLVVAAGLILNALFSLREKQLAKPGWIAFYAALISLISKEILYRWTVREGTRLKSPAVIANAWHHRSDALSSLPAVCAVAGARISPDWGFLDHLGSVVVSFFIVQASWRIGWQAVQRLMDSGAPPEIVERIRFLACELANVADVHAIRTRHLGQGWSVDLHMLVDGRISVREGHDIAEQAKTKLLHNGPDILDVVVHVEPAAEEPGNS
jgi:cation diffusion facilitator family transporter